MEDLATTIAPSRIPIRFGLRNLLKDEVTMSSCPCLGHLADSLPTFTRSLGQPLGDVLSLGEH